MSQPHNYINIFSPTVWKDLNFFILFVCFCCLFFFFLLLLVDYDFQLARVLDFRVFFDIDEFFKLFVES